MRHLNKNQSIALFVSIGFMAYVFFGETLINIFNSPVQEDTSMETNIPVTTQDTSVGTGAIAAAGDKLTVHYVGRLMDGRVFDSSRDRNTPFEFILGVGQVIRGWDEGMVGMRVGGKRELVISPEYAYGSQSVGTIPPNSTLIFEVELLNVEKPQ